MEKRKEVAIEDTPDIVDVYALLLLGANFSFVTFFLGNKLDITPISCWNPFCFVHPLVSRLWLNVSIKINVVPSDLFELDIVDFDVILNMDWFHVSYAFVSCRTYRVKFQFSNESIL